MIVVVGRARSARTNSRDLAPGRGRLAARRRQRRAATGITSSTRRMQPHQRREGLLHHPGEARVGPMRRASVTAGM